MVLRVGYIELTALCPCRASSFVQVASPKSSWAISASRWAMDSSSSVSAVAKETSDSSGKLAGAPSSVDETTFGAMGTFYRVRLGPYPNEAATKAPCDALKANGLDCLVTAK